MTCGEGEAFYSPMVWGGVFHRACVSELGTSPVFLVRWERVSSVGWSWVPPFPHVKGSLVVSHPPGRLCLMRFSWGQACLGDHSAAVSSRRARLPPHCRKHWGGFLGCLLREPGQAPGGKCHDILTPSPHDWVPLEFLTRSVIPHGASSNLPFMVKFLLLGAGSHRDSRLSVCSS